MILVLANADLRQICGSGKSRTRGDFNGDGENRFWLTDCAYSVHSISSEVTFCASEPLDQGKGVSPEDTSDCTYEKSRSNLC